MQKKQNLRFRKKDLSEVEKNVLLLFFDSSSRPKKTLKHEMSIFVNLEKKHPPWIVKTALRNLEKKKILNSKTQKISNLGTLKFYFLTITGSKSSPEIKKRIHVMIKWIERYSENKKTTMIGQHLHDVVRSEIRAHGFEIIGEKTNEFNGKKWKNPKETLDIIAQNKIRNITVGIEVKNTLYLIQKPIISKKIKMCKHLKINPIFACRWLEPHRKIIEKHNGFLWQFNNQLYPLGQEKFVSELEKKFKFPVSVGSEIPGQAIQEFEAWLENFES